MIYAYIRVSTHKQTTENQRLEIAQFCTKRQITIDHWISETITGTKGVSHRRLGSVMRKMRSGDILICTELSRLGRSIFMIMNLLSECMQRNIQLWTVKERYVLGSDIPSKVLAFAFSLTAELERTLISSRTKEGIARARREGKCIGRPHNIDNQYASKLRGREAEIEAMARKGIAKSEIARRLKVSRTTLWRFLSIASPNVITT